MQSGDAGMMMSTTRHHLSLPALKVQVGAIARGSLVGTSLYTQSENVLYKVLFSPIDHGVRGYEMCMMDSGGERSSAIA